MNHVSNQKGFTLVELLLAMSFVSLLLMAIALTVVQITGIYNKGLTLRAVDQVGQALTQDIRRSIEAARVLDVGTPAVGGANYKPQIALGGDINDPDGGRLCTGSYSYIWNNGKAFNNPVNKYELNNTLIRLVKVPDNGGLYCADLSRNIDRSLATEMLDAGDRELAIQSFSVSSAVQNSDLQQALYQITLEIGTNDQEALARSATLLSIDTSCKPPSEDQGLKNFCAVNKFEFTARAGNTGGGR